VISIAGGGWRAALLPERGGALASLSHDGRDVLAPLPPGDDPNHAWAGAFVMIPWTNRLDEGRLPHPGGVHRFPLNRAEERTALHGLSRDHPWAVEAASADRAVLTQLLEEGPYRYEARLEVSLGEAFALAVTVVNRGADGTPFGTGWHPFLVRRPGTRLDLRATAALARDGRNLPTRAEASSGVSGGEGAFAGLDTHFTGWDGAARIDLGGPGGGPGGGPVLAMRASGAWAANVQVFAPRGASVISVEPVSHVPDVVNRPRLAPLGDMRRLARGEAMRGEVSLRVEAGG